jgi:hypothetical protein
VEYIAKSFGITAKAPDWLTGITLSEIGVGFNTATKDFHFEVTGKIPIAGNPLVIKLSFRLEKKGDNYSRHINGKLFIGDSTEFVLDIDSSPSDTRISAEWIAENPSGYLRFEDLASKLGFKNLPDIPSSLKLTLTGAKFLYDSKAGLFVIAVTTEHFGAAVFVSSILEDKSRFYGFGVRIPLHVKLADIPLVGNKIPGADNIGIPEATVWILSAPLSNTDVTDVNKNITDTNLPSLPAGPLHARVLLHAVLHLGATQEKPIDLALGNTTPHVSLAAASDAEPPSTPTWIDIQKQFGVFIFNRIGFAYHDNQLQFLLDAGMEMGPLSFTLDGLSISSPLTAFKPTFDISGLGLAYHQGALDIEGALLKLPKEQLGPDTNFQFDGLAVIKAGRFSLSAVGSYAQLKSGDPSMFLFVQVEAPIGGPPAFFITGVMGGFGFNRSLALPGMDEVAAFPLLSLAEPPAPGENAPTQNPMHVLDVLSGREPAKQGGEKRTWIAASAGEYWLALGLQFTSFQIVKSRALLIAEFGHDLSFALLGLSTLQLPQTSDGKHPYVFAELQLRAVLQPNEGFFGLSALLSGNSFVLTPDCHLTGGFAFYFWFGSHPMSGQFVVSMGGYHPAFSKPDDYPALPRLGFNWAVSSTITIKGGAYFALTPSCVMAGGALEAVFHDGSIKAWFTAHADFLIAWRPFFFTASVGVSIGVEVNFGSDDSHSGFSFSVSADVELWGPPTGGRAHVHVIFITFTVHFGSDDAAANNKALPWHEFNELLPHSANVCRIIASDGISKTEESKTSTSGKTWMVRSGTFSFVTESAIPSSEIAYGQKQTPVFSAKNSVTGNPIDIRPMNKTGVRSEHRLQLFKDNEPVNCESQGWVLKPRKATTPEALWGKPPASFSQVPGSPKAAMTGELLSGYEVIAPAPSLGPGPGAVPVKSLLLDYLSPEGKTALRSTEPPNPDYLPAFDENSIVVIQNISNTEAQAARKKMCATLLDLGLYSGANESMIRLGQECTHLYDTAPLLQ